MEPRYLGDGVYASYSNGMIMITTGSHLEREATHVIWLEPEVVKALFVYIKQTAEEYRWGPLEN